MSGARARLASLVLGASAVTLVMTGCGTTGKDDSADLDISSFSSVQAVLDPVNGTIELPLHSYFTDENESISVTRANNIIMNRCLVPLGYEMPIDLNTGVFPGGDRNYGVWVKAFVAKHGYDVPPTPSVEVPKAMEHPSFPETYQSCVEQLDGQLLPEMREGNLAATDQAAIGREIAYSQAIRDDRWRGVRAEWASCLEAEGIIADVEGPTTWIPDYPEDTMAQIGVALQDVECKESTNMIQKLANIEASYQAAYIARHEAAFAELKDEKDETLKMAASLIAGG